MIFFLYGENTFLSHQKLEEIKNKFLREVDTQGDSLHFLDGETLTMDELNRAVAPASLFSRKRMIIISDFFQNKDETIFDAVLNYLKNKLNTENIIIFRERQSLTLTNIKKSQKKLFLFLNSKQEKITIFSQEFKNLTHHQMNSWLKQEFEKRNKKISLQNINLISSLLENDLWRAYNEVEKISNYSNETEISEKEIKIFIKGKFNDNIFLLTDAIATKNTNQAVRILEEQFELGVSEQYLFAMILRQFKLLLKTKSFLKNNPTRQNLAKELKIHPFVAKKTIQQSSNFSLQNLKKIFSKLLLIDKKIKTGESNLKTELSLLIV